MNNGGLGLLCKLRSEWSTATNDSAFCCSLKSCLDFSKKKKQKRKKVFSNHGFKDVGTHYVKKLFCLPRTRFKIFPLLVKDLQGPDASRTKEFVWSPETHQKCLVTPSDEHDYKENMAQASFQESRMEFSGPYFKKSMSSGPREASRKALGYVLASSIPKLPFCSVVALPHQTPPWCPRLWPHPAQPSMSWHLPRQVGRPLFPVCSGTPRFYSWKSHVTGALYPPIPIPGKPGQLITLVTGY